MGGNAVGSILAMMLALWAVGPSSALADDVAGVATYTAADRQDKLLEGARREGGLTLYSSATTADMAVVLPAFETKYGLKVKFWRGDSEGILQRAVTETRGGRNEFDVIETSGATMEALRREELLQQVASPVFADISPKGQYPHGAWIASRFQVQSNAYNTATIRPEDAPKSWDDLASPRWKGKIGVESENAIWLGALAQYMGEDKAIALFRAIGANGVTLRKGHTLLANLVASGETPIGLGLYRYREEQLRNEGAPIAPLDFEPLVVHPIGVGLSRQAPHPNAALLFIDFLLTDAQKIFLGRETRPTNIRVAPEPSPAVYIDHAIALDQATKWRKIFRDVLVSRPR